MAIAWSSAQVRTYAQRFVISAVRKGLTANEIQRQLSSIIINTDTGQTLGYRRTNLLSDIARYKENPPRMPRLSQAERARIYQSSMIITVPYPGAHRYLYPYTISGYDASTGTPHTITFSFTSHVLLTPELADNLALTAVDFSRHYNIEADPLSLTALSPMEFGTR